MAKILGPNKPVSLAVVSGKGGSGKTLVATRLAAALSGAGQDVLLVDADLGTGGLTYYLGYGTYKRLRDGLSEWLTQDNPSFGSSISFPSLESLDRRSDFHRVAMMGVGDHRRIYYDGTNISAAKIDMLISSAAEMFSTVIFDCRGGIDDDSVAICSAVNEILIVAETDAASIQSTGHLANVLKDKGLSRRIAGFCLNKVMDDPTSLALTGQTIFGCEFLGAIPFDIETTRDFIRGKIPPKGQLFARHVHGIGERIFSDALEDRVGGLLRPQDFGSTTLEGATSRYGTAIVAGLTAVSYILIIATFISNQYLIEIFLSGTKRPIGIATGSVMDFISMSFALVLFLVSLLTISVSPRLRSGVGFLVVAYTKWINALFLKR